ncbi:hypothetical protein HID58_058163 [Brassica napus]|uniref:EF-hand domain-containing protein n=1 Tax=Brassica napus TaxID=3708 RepID=A0ABQ7ZPT9_BRANA|nr:hypothetical protein HID58_058163 [Brassica napus]
MEGCWSTWNVARGGSGGGGGVSRVHTYEREEEETVEKEEEEMVEKVEVEELGSTEMVVVVVEEVIAEHLSVEEASGIKERFQVMDTSNRGKITIDELRIGLRKLGIVVPQDDIQILMDAVSY